MLAHPCGRIVAVEQQFEPENNEVVTRAATWAGWRAGGLAQNEEKKEKKEKTLFL